jgi:hypothetical protein
VTGPGRVFALVAALAACTPAPTRAWGSATHQWITREALARVADDPAVAPIARDPQLVALLLGGSVAPDMMLALSPVPVPRKRGELTAGQRAHLVFKDRKIGEALLQRARTGAEWAAALGFVCHQLQDEVGDHDEGYPVRKTSALPQRALFNEVMLDLLLFAEPDFRTEPIALSPEGLAAASREAGYTLEVGALQRARRAFAWARAGLRGFLKALMASRSPRFQESLGAFYADARDGLQGQPGLEELVRQTAAEILRHARGRPGWLKHLRATQHALQEPAPPLLEEVTEEVARMARPLLRALDLPSHSDRLHEWYSLRALPVAYHLLNLWTLDEEDFASLCERSTALRREALRRLRERRRRLRLAARQATPPSSP